MHEENINNENDRLCHVLRFFRLYFIKISELNRATT